ncbi:ketimine reductase mu-crystallin [Sitophilus oryzae]|uniref:Ketimine reductase mu-crystallin n=1 Tax=Sitophilus oryzae TaxID=7048 RepID=A0A6J2YMZ0_SITOR|nr:ketimine reductase mu-crystallin [Sitophilus oryzae]
MLYLQEKEIGDILTWPETFEATEAALKSVSQRKVTISSRVFSEIQGTKKWMVTMSGSLEDKKYGAWCCKILTGNPENVDKNLPSFSGSILHFDDSTGILKSVIDGRLISNYRTAAASAVATKYLFKPEQERRQILSVLGLGEQGVSHAEAFYNYFNFDEIRLWNRTSKKAQTLTNNLNKKFQTDKFKFFENNRDCVTDADVIVTATIPSDVPIVKYDWIKSTAHINAVGVSTSSGLELDSEIYKKAKLYVDHKNSAEIELKKLKSLGVDLGTEIGEVVLGQVSQPSPKTLTVFQSLGLVVEDCAMVRMISDKYSNKL